METKKNARISYPKKTTYLSIMQISSFHQKEKA